MTEEGCVPLQFEADVEDGGGTQQRISFAAPSQVRSCGENAAAACRVPSGAGCFASTLHLPTQP